MAMTDDPLWRLPWQVVDTLDYLQTLAKLGIVDAVAGPEPETPADQQRKCDRERIERAFPEIDCKGSGALLSHRADRVPIED